MILIFKNKLFKNLFYFVTVFFSLPVFSQEKNGVILVHFLNNALFSGQVCSKNGCSYTLHLGDTYVIHNPSQGDKVCVRIYDALFSYDYLFKIEKIDAFSEINFWGNIVDRGFNVTKGSIKYVKGKSFNGFSNMNKLCDSVL